MRRRTPSDPTLLRTLVAATLTSAALALSACGGDETTTASGGSSTPKKAPAVELEDQLGFDQAGIQARQSRIEAAIRDCMKSDGFDYIPIDPLAQRAALLGSSRLSDEDFLRQFGYGISTLWGRGSAQTDPNQRLRASLQPADRRAYDRALFGENVGTTFQSAVENGDFAKLGGCTRKATETVFGGAQVLTQIQGKFDALDERILEDQRMVKAHENWAKCMADAGYRYEEPDEIDSDLFRRAEQIVGPLSGPFTTGPAPGEKARTINKTALAKLQREEVAIARADYDCELKHITPVETVVRPQYEARFREQNQGLIAQIKPVR